MELADADTGADCEAPEGEFVPVVAALVRVSVALIVAVIALGVVAASVLDSASLDSVLVGASSVGRVAVTPTAEQAAT